MPQAPSEVWSVDFVMDALEHGRRLKCLTIVDDFTKEAIDIVVVHGISGQYVTPVLDQPERFRKLAIGRLLAGAAYFPSRPSNPAPLCLKRPFRLAFAGFDGRMSDRAVATGRRGEARRDEGIACATSRPFRGDRRVIGNFINRSNNSRWLSPPGFGTVGADCRLLSCAR